MWLSDLLSLFGAHDRNKSPSVGSRDHFPLGFIAGIGLCALHSCNSEWCWFFTASQLSVCYSCRNSVFVWTMAIRIAVLLRIAMWLLLLHSFSSAWSRFILRVERFNSSVWFFGFIGMKPIDSLSPLACSMQPKSSLCSLQSSLLSRSSLSRRCIGIFVSLVFIGFKAGQFLSPRHVAEASCGLRAPCSHRPAPDSSSCGWIGIEPIPSSMDIGIPFHRISSDQSRFFKLFSMWPKASSSIDSF